MCVATPTVYKPKMASNASSRAIRLSEGEALDKRTMDRKAESESDRTRANAVVPGNQILNPTKIANASHNVLNPESPTEAWNRRRSEAGKKVADHEMGAKFSKRIPAKPQGEASVAI